MVATPICKALNPSKLLRIASLGATIKLKRAWGVFMRIAVLPVALCLSMVGLATGAAADAAIKKHIDIPAQNLGTALQQFAHERGIQVVYLSESVDSLKTRGAVGEFSADEVLKHLLNGTGMTYRYLNDRTVTIIPTGAGRDTEAPAPSQTPAGSRGTTKEAGKSSSQDFRVAQVAATDSSVDKSPHDEQASQKSPAKIEEIIVTAQKRAETVNKTPIAVTALDMEQLTNAGVVGMTDLPSNVPDLQVHTVGVDGYFGVTIRGISNLTYVPSGNPAVSTYVDGVYVDLPIGLANTVFDLGRIEILRGPQGTLYGRNSTGGNVNIETADPKNVFAAAADVSYGNYNDVLTHAMVNIPLTDTLAVRFALMNHRSDGYFDTEGTTGRNYGAADDWAARLTTLWKPTEQFKWRLSLEGSATRGTPGASIETGSDGLPLDGLSPYHQPVNSDPEPQNHIDNGTIRSRMEYAVTDSLTLTYVAGHQHLWQFYNWATSGQVGSPEDPAYQNFSSISSSSQTHEIDATYFSHKLTNVLGATYFKDSIVLDYHAVYPVIALSANEKNDDTNKTSWGIFDQSTYNLTDSLHLTAGVRYSHDHQSESQFTSIFCALSATPNLTVYDAQFLTETSPGCGAYPTAAGEGTWSKVTWKGGLDYDLNALTLLYGSVTSGYKQGGAQPGLPSTFAATFQPETVTNYEIGGKFRLLEDSLNVRVAGFYEQYTNIQTAYLISIPGFIGTATNNAGAAKIYGAELESEWNITAANHLKGFLTYLHAQYTDYRNAVDPRDSSTVIPSLAGNQLPNAPEISARMQYSHDFRLGNGGTLSPEVLTFWQSRSYTNALNVDVYKVPAYSKTGVRLKYTDPSGRWNIAAYGDNLENHAVRTGNYSGSGIVFSDFAPPRTYGLRLSFAY